MISLHMDSACARHGIAFDVNACPQQSRTNCLIRHRMRRVLVVDIRDEVYAMISSELSDKGLIVDRVENASDVLNKTIQFEPDLVLVNEAFPDESGWLLTRKLRFSHRSLAIWLYTATRWGCNSAWADMAGADAIINYDGDVFRLVAALNLQLQVDPKQTTHPDLYGSDHFWRVVHGENQLVGNR